MSQEEEAYIVDYVERMLASFRSAIKQEDCETLYAMCLSKRCAQRLHLAATVAGLSCGIDMVHDEDVGACWRVTAHVPEDWKA